MRQRLFALIYLPFDRLQRRPLAAVRDALVGDLVGDVIEVGCGPGSNFAHYRAAARVTAVDSNPHMLAAARRAAERAEAEITVLEADALRLPVGDASADAYVTALVLCSVADVEAALREARRVLRPGGQLRLFEHVRSHRPAFARLQRWLSPAWSVVADGCHLDRDPVAALHAAGFDDIVIEATSGGGLVPMVLVSARKAPHRREAATG
ncbi:MAG: methyltransferase domain-containing protein [Chloroflexi bacterium]|nr:methyltransferase domain-containing protein [Chloroflexota bacterium]MDA1239221.1 methyltransferase domain-containing protein [Chloroflexota bacterium]